MKALKGKCIHMMDKIINIALQRSLPRKKKKKLLLNWGILLILLLHFRVTGVILNLSNLPVIRNIISKQLIRTFRGDGLNRSLGWSINVDKSRFGYEAVT